MSLPYLKFFNGFLFYLELFSLTYKQSPTQTRHSSSPRSIPNSLFLAPMVQLHWFSFCPQSKPIQSFLDLFYTSSFPSSPKLYIIVYFSSFRSQCILSPQWDHSRNSYLHSNLRIVFIIFSDFNSLQYNYPYLVFYFLFIL